MDNRKPFIAGNWKMFKTGSEAIKTAEELVKLVADVTDTEVMIAPPFTALSAVSDVVKETNVSLGAQNFFWENEGAYTGEISSAMLLSAGCKYVIIGHSERRQFFGETDETVNKKLKLLSLLNYYLFFVSGSLKKKEFRKIRFLYLTNRYQKV